MAVNPAESPVTGALFGSDAMRAVFDERAFLARMLDVEAALARAEARTKVIPGAAAAAILRAASALAVDLDRAELARSAAKVGYPVVALVDALSRAAGPDAGRWTHWGATTQDILDTALVLQVRDGLALVRAELVAIVRALAALADRHRGAVMAGRTHLQHAAPTTFGLKCAGWLEPLVAHVERLDQLRPRVERVQLGGAVGTLASLGTSGIAVLEALAADLGLAVPAIPWHTARDGFVEAVCLLGLVAGSASKIATDVALLSQTEVAEVAEGAADGRGGSSTMPQKRNPIASEYVVAAARGVHALVPLMLGAMAQDHESATGPWQAEALALPQAFVLTHGALVHTRRIAEALAVDAPRMRRNVDASRGLIMAEAAMMALAPRLGRGEAHHVVERACRTAQAEGIDLAAALAREPHGAAHLDRAELDRVTDPSRYLGSADGFIDRVLARARPLRE